jgi:integrase
MSADRFRLFRRGKVFYAQDSVTGKQESLRTKDRKTAQRWLLAKNEAHAHPVVNLGVARAHLLAHDPRMNERTWSNVMDELCVRGRDSSQERSRRACASKPFDWIRSKVLVETTSEDLLQVLHVGGTATNNYLRRLHNLALSLGWLAWPILSKAAWPKLRCKQRRSISEEEHLRIVTTESNFERRLFYQLLWETGGAQSDIACLTSANITWSERLLWFHRGKLDLSLEPAKLRIGPRLEELLRQLPAEGFLFPGLAKISAKYRAAEFSRRCRVLKIKGISLHSYRYAWAERAKNLGYPERFAMAHLGHNSPAVHRAYAKKAKFICPSLDEFEAEQKTKVIAFPAAPIEPHSAEEPAVESHQAN